MSTWQIEIAICTRNRANQLAETLKRFVRLQTAWNAACPNDWRLLIVDNASTDQTADVIAEFAQTLDILALHEPNQGHVHARNCAIDAAKSELLLWTDDDVTVDSDWLPVYRLAAEQQPTVDFWGSKISPVFDGLDAPPKWISENWSKLSGCFAARDLGDEPLEFTSDVLPYGANFAIRTGVQKRFLFGEEFGRSGSLVSGEDELDVFRRMLAAGHQGQWIANAPVVHRIDAERRTVKYISRYFEGQGRALVAKGKAWSRDASALKKEADHELFWAAAKRWFTRSEVWLSHLIRGSLARGQWQAVSQEFD